MVPFNESWEPLTQLLLPMKPKKKPPSRLVDHASGWFNQKKGGFRNVHNYFLPLKVERDVNRAFVISDKA